MEIQHFSHKHPLMLQTENMSEIHRIKCHACSKFTFDLMYSCKTCKNLHKTCAELPAEISHHPFHPSRGMYIMFNGPSYICGGCGKKHDKLFYCCRWCHFTLNPESTLNPTTGYEIVAEGRIKHFLHEHPLNLALNSLVLTKKDNTYLVCEKLRSFGESYQSCHNYGTFDLHGSCWEKLLRAVSHSSHPEHPMILHSKDRSFDQPCTACNRTDNTFAYRCSICQVEMDIACALKQTKHPI